MMKQASTRGSQFKVGDVVTSPKCEMYEQWVGTMEVVDLRGDIIIAKNYASGMEGGFYEDNLILHILSNSPLYQELR